jgi:hypothetical protein
MPVAHFANPAGDTFCFITVLLKGRPSLIGCWRHTAELGDSDLARHRRCDAPFASEKRKKPTWPPLEAVVGHVGLFTDEPPGKTELLFI